MTGKRLFIAGAAAVAVAGAGGGYLYARSASVKPVKPADVILPDDSRESTVFCSSLGMYIKKDESCP